MASEGDAVVVHVYDLSQGMAAAMSPMLLGRRIDLVPHTGVVLRAREFFYGGGIVSMPPHRVVERFGMRPNEALVLGRTRRSDAEVRAFLAEVRPRFTPERYDLLRHNCNTFSSAFCMFLVDIPVPRRIMEIPGEPRRAFRRMRRHNTSRCRARPPTRLPR